MDKLARAILNPINSLNLLSRAEIEAFTTTRGELFDLYRSCALAILNTDSNKDDAAEIYENFSDFDLRLVPQPRGLRLELFNAPAQAFVDGRMIRGIQEHLFAALRDIVYTDIKSGAELPGHGPDVTN
ncbi:MAG: pyrimidine/purine nucleosidase domain-containing protein, partial [Haliea sp.]